MTEEQYQKSITEITLGKNGVKQKFQKQMKTKKFGLACKKKSKQPKRKDLL